MPEPEPFTDETRQRRIVNLQKDAIELRSWKSCANCVEFHDDDSADTPLFCSLAKQNIPARVFAVGCHKWTDRDEIPF